MKLYRRGKNYYLRDGSFRVSLHTTKKGVAEFKLRQYLLEKNGMVTKKLPTVGEYYEKWIETKREPIARKSLRRSYVQHFTRYVLSGFVGGLGLRNVTAESLSIFRRTLLMTVSVKTAKNIFSSLQAMWRDASAEYELKNPFASLQWPRVPKQRPAAFGLMEVSAILATFRKFEPFYFPWVLTQFSTGMRPSEAAALTWADVQDGAITTQWLYFF